MAFTVKSTNGRPEPGIYTAFCETDHENSRVVTTFTVIESAIPTPTLGTEPTFTPTPTLTPTSTPASIVGHIIFDYAKAQSSRPGAGNQANEVTNVCIPEVTIATDGKVSGTCEKLHIQARLVDESFTVQVIGSVDPSGTITFTYEVSEIGNPNGVWRVAYSGNGVLTSDTQSADMADFSYSCLSGQDNLLWCGYLAGTTSEEFTGTIPWSFGP